MNAETFLELAEQGGFLEPKTANKLRNHLAGSSSPVSAEDLAKLLVSRNVLTDEQSVHLLKATGAAASGELQLESDFKLGPSRRPADTRKSLDLLNEKDDQDLPLLSPESIAKPSGGGFMQDGPRGTETPSAADDSVEVPGLAPIGGEMNLSNSGVFDAALDDDFSVTRPTGVVATLRGLFARNKYKGQRWDSSLMMIGGGALLLLSLIGGALYFVLATGSGDEYFDSAEADYKAQLYTNAIQKYNQYLDRYPRHNKVSLARVRVGLAHVRGEVATENWDAALQTAASRIEEIRNEEEFPAARPELAGILPSIYEGFVESADTANLADKKESWLGQANKVRELIDNPDNLPSSQKRQISSQLDRIQERIEKISRDIARQRQVAKTVSQINDAVAAGDSGTAYSLRDELLDRYPGAAKNPQFQDAVMKITSAEQKSVKMLSDAISAETSERPSKARQLSVPLTARSAGSAPDLKKRVIYTQARGALYAIQGKDGGVLWRRWLGFESYTPPVALGSDPSDVVAIDHRHGDLIRCAAETGNLVWRVAIGKSPCAPVVWDDLLFQATTEGKLYSIRADDGSITRAAAFPQPLTSPPGVDRQDHLLYQAGSHSTLYILDADNFECMQTVFIGHSEGMITVAPTITKDHVLVIENGATDYSQLHVFARETQGKIKKVGKPIRLKGIVVDPPITYGRNILIATDRGAVYVFESDSGNLVDPVRIFAQVHPRNSRTSDHFGLLSGDRILVAGTGLSEYEVNAARGELTLKWTTHLADVHLASASLIGDTVVTKRRSTSGGDVVVEAAQIPPSNAGNQAPKPIWTTRIAASPAGTPVVDESQKQFLVTAQNGSAWTVNKDSFRKGIVQCPWSEDLTPVASVIRFPAGVVYTSADLRPNWQFDDSNGSKKRIQIDAVQKRLATLPVRFGDGLLVCTTNGPIIHVDAATGKKLSKPYELPLGRGESVTWLKPARARDVAWVASEEGLVQRLETSDKALKATRSADLKIQLVGQPAIVGNLLYLAARTRKGDSIIVLAADSLEIVEKLPSDSRVTAGPVLIGDHVMMATVDGQWMAMASAQDSKPTRVWKAALPFGPLAGDPVMHQGLWVCAAQSGDVFLVEPTTGELVEWSAGQPTLQLAEPLGSGVAILEQSRLLLVAGRGGTLHAAPLSEASR